MSEIEKKALGISCFLLVSGLMGVDFFNPSLPYMMASLHVSQTSMKNLIVVYMLVLGLAQFFYGTFSDRYGRKPAIVAGFAIAVAGLAGSAFAQGIDALYVARGVTAFGTAGCTVISRALIVDVFRDQRALKKAFSYFAMSSQLSPAMAPLLGGAIQQYWGWRASFAVFALVMCLSLIFIVFAMPETHAPHERSVLNLRDIFTPYLKLFGNFKFIAYSIASALMFSFTIGYYSASPYAFHALGYSPVTNSLFYLSYSTAILFGAWLLSSVLSAIRSPRLYLGAIMSYSAIFLIALALNISDSGLKIVIFSFFLGATSGVGGTLALVLSMSSVETSRGATSALQGAIKMFFTGVFLLAFDAIHIVNFSSLIEVFLFLVLFLWLIWILDFAREKRLKKNASSMRGHTSPI